MKLTGRAKEEQRKYHRLHYSLRTKYGKANRCDFKDTICTGNSKYYEYALKKDREYSDNPDDYFQLCKSCHTKYDGYNLSDKGRDKLKSSMSKTMKGRTPINKGVCSKIEKNCKKCNSVFKDYKSQNRKYCSVDCRVEDMKNKPSRNKNGRKGNA